MSCCCQAVWRGEAGTAGEERTVSEGRSDAWRAGILRQKAGLQAACKHAQLPALCSTLPAPCPSPAPSPDADQVTGARAGGDAVRHVPHHFYPPFACQRTHLMPTRSELPELEAMTSDLSSTSLRNITIDWSTPSRVWLQGKGRRRAGGRADRQAPTCPSSAGG